MRPANMKRRVVQLRDNRYEGVNSWRALGSNSIGDLPVGDALDDVFDPLLVSEQHGTSGEKSQFGEGVLMKCLIWSLEALHDTSLPLDEGELVAELLEEGCLPVSP